ncbi:DUF2076 domain-containing protein [Inquilinus sp.]|jgi:hypothetical protein|uniref:DUF2076 domain-containing protein n=1 Tax=Inquilinus sp. TaxID=1932117 RepID=UPI0037851BA5
MTPQERELLTNLVARLKQAPPAEQDQEAVAMVRDLVRDLPDAPYLLAQTVLIQDYALHQAQSRIAELERQAQPQRAGGGGSFLGAIFGSAAPSRPQPAPQQAPAYTQAPPAYAPAQPGPWGGGGPFAQSSGPSFLRSAAATAAGVAGGALLFQGIESLFGAGHGLGGFGSAAPGLTETVVNNYYGDAAPGTDGTDLRDADAIQPDDAGQGVTDADYQDDGGQDDFGGDDFGSGGDDTVGV